jgi:predicted transcriptional regulator
MNNLEALQTMGLSDKESKAYLALLELGQASAYAVAERAGLKKPTAYVLLDELVRKNLALKIPRAGKKKYRAKPPEDLFRDTEARLEQAKQKIPELAAFARAFEGSVPKTLFYEGLKGVEDAMWYRMKEMKGKSFVGFYASTVHADEKLNDIFLRWNKENAELHISSRAIVPDHPSLKLFRSLDTEHLRTVKIIPHEKYSSNISIEANDYFVRFVMLKEQQAVIFDNPHVATAMRQLFELLWEKL